jgi:hypothetical protein
MDRLNLKAIGPFYWFKNPSILKDQTASQYGVYFWTARTNGGEFIYYVGETGKSFSKRMIEHLKEYLSGHYRILDPVELAKGNKVVLWRGMFMKGPKPDITDFVQHNERYMPALRGMLELFNIWIFPMDCQRNIRRRVEGAIAKSLYSQPGEVGKFQDPGIRYVTRKTGEKPIQVHIRIPNRIEGLASLLEV